MFSRTYTEGRRGFSATRPKTVELPEDDAVAMNTICSLIHFQPLKNGAQQLSNADLFNVCVVADKYDCVAAVRYSFLNCNAIPLNDNYKDMMRLLASAYLVKDRFTFRSVSQHIVRNFAHVELKTPAACQDRLPERICGMLP